MGRKGKKAVIGGTVLFGISVILQICARSFPAFADGYARMVYPLWVGIFGRFFGIFPFSVVEISIYALVFGAIVYGMRHFREPINLVGKTWFLVSLLFFLFTVNCGINYYAVPFSIYAGLETGQYSTEDLKQLCEFLVERVNENLSAEAYQDHRLEWRQEGVASMRQAGNEYESLSGFYPLPKEVTVSAILSVQQLSGVYAPFTIEANFNGDMPDYNIPHTICHELSHLKGFMREDEANFIGYLACIRSDRQAFRYSGYLTGWVYAGNALYRENQEAYFTLYEQLSDEAKRNLKENNAFWRQYEGKVAEVSTQINDTYLKMNDQADGVKSYGRMVDLMLSDFKKKAP